MFKNPDSAQRSGFSFLITPNMDHRAKRGNPGIKQKAVLRAAERFFYLNNKELEKSGSFFVLCLYNIGTTNRLIFVILF